MNKKALFESTSHYFADRGPSVFANRLPRPQSQKQQISSQKSEEKQDLHLPSQVSPQEIPQTQKEAQKSRSLAPDHLCKMLKAEIDHFFQVENEIALFSDIVGKYQSASHEKYISNHCFVEDCEAELKELKKLDQEIIRLEAILDRRRTKK